MEPEAFKQLEAQLREQIKATDPEIRAQAEELQRHRQREAQEQFSNDLKAIRKAYPDEKAKSVDELGVEFLKLCASGIKPLVAYEADIFRRKRVLHARRSGSDGPGDGKQKLRKNQKIHGNMEVKEEF